ncbi:Scr1 family TA system antitoxin-like transcriptional regulator [Streptomyces sp. NRRL S-350]|uniref:Scr1 family TA system antitoxin-like transcriptional regulator n=1 Tax=Streptomyces sp. NRRL S-350 TaxID=1463902 RepID=UPI003B675A1A
MRGGRLCCLAKNRRSAGRVTSEVKQQAESRRPGFGAGFGTPRSPRSRYGRTLVAPRVAYLEGVQSGQLLEAPDQVTNVALVYDTLRAEALTPDDSLAWLQRASEEHPE